MTQDRASYPAPVLRRERVATIAFVSGVGLLLVLAVIVGVLGYLNRWHEDRIGAANDARHALDHLFGVVIEAETAQRGYLIAGEPAFLEPYHRSLERLSDARSALASSLALVGFEPARMASLETLVQHKQHLLAHPIELAHQHGRDIGRGFVATGQGRQNMDRIRRMVEDLRDELELQVSLDTAAARHELRMLVAAVAVFLLASILLSTLQFIASQRELRSRRQIETELRRSSREIRLFAAMADALQAADGRSESYSVIERYAGELMPNLRGGLHVYSSSRDHLAAAAVWRDAGGVAASSPEFTQQECWALRRGKPHHSGPGLPDLPCPHVLDKTASNLCFPISARGETSSVLHLAVAPERGKAAVAAAAATAATLADQLALALANMELQERLRAQAIRDPLTGLHNRHFLEEVLPRELQRAARAQRQLGVLMLDIDHFKRFNDSYGHDAGDAVLRLTAREIESVLREADLVCRFGGEEIIVILPDSDAASSMAVAEKIRTAIRERDVSSVAAGAPGVTASIGVAVYPDCGTTGEALISAADAALYGAKRGGRDRVEAATALADKSRLSGAAA